METYHAPNGLAKMFDRIDVHPLKKHMLRALLDVFFIEHKQKKKHLTLLEGDSASCCTV